MLHKVCIHENISCVTYIHMGVYMCFMYMVKVSYARRNITPGPESKRGQFDRLWLLSL